jgi:integrase
MPLASITTTHKIERRYDGAVADQQKALISNLWEEAKDHAEIDRKGKINPTLDTKVRYRVKKTTKAWSAEAHEAATARSTLTLAADLLYFTGQRGGDATKVRWSDIHEVENGKRLFLRVVQEKTGKLWHQLPESLAERPKLEPHISEEFVLTNVWKRPWPSASALSHAMTRHFRKIGIRALPCMAARGGGARHCFDKRRHRWREGGHPACERQARPPVRGRTTTRGGSIR